MYNLKHTLFNTKETIPKTNIRYKLRHEQYTYKTYSIKDKTYNTKHTKYKTYIIYNKTYNK